MVSVALLVVLVLFVGRSIALLGLIWLMGVGIHYLPPLRIERPFARRAVVVLALIAFAGMLAWTKSTYTPSGDWLLGVVTTGLIYVVLSCSRTPAPRAYKWTAHALSRSSYTLYLVHIPFVVFLVTWVGRIRLAPDRNQMLLMTGVFLAAMAYAQVVWFLFEKRTDVLREWLKPFVLGTAAKTAPQSATTYSS